MVKTQLPMITMMLPVITREKKGSDFQPFVVLLALSLALLVFCSKKSFITMEILCHLFNITAIASTPALWPDNGHKNSHKLTAKSQ